ncbi:MAG: hypothetical protein HKM23_09610 [Nitrosopumilus sp.]|nr:hypothetical protein [Nitrosopumilus sp.]NNL53365.1 hypothetical protein [Nitrosopumilus sp.]NNM03315.1 hypothetical protein [Nitrosopumilus sp.]
MACKDICINYKAKKPKNSSRYLSGQKRCFKCSLFIIWKGLTCPCCGFKLRVKPRTAKYRKQFRIARNITYI